MHKTQLADEIEKEGIERVVYGKDLTTVRWINETLLEALRSTPPEALRSEPVDPESEAANPVWDLVIQTCAQAWPAGLLTWSQSPTELIVKLIDERDEARAAFYEIKHVAYHFLESGEERVSDSEVAFDLPNEDYDKLVALLGDAHPEPTVSVPSPLARITPIAEAKVPMLDALNEPCKNCGKKPIDLMDFS